MIARSSDVARSLLGRVEELEAENARLRTQVDALEHEAVVLVDRLTRARAERRPALAPPLGLSSARPA